MLINVEIAGAERTALLLPEIAVTQIGRDSFVFRVGDKGSVEQVKVVAASRRDGKVEIVEGVAIGDRIVVDGTGKLRPGNTIVEAGAGKPDAPAAKKG
jgi:membrane fusion protein (multidrug efflux system)